jgi:hypothetical protein
VLIVYTLIDTLKIHNRYLHFLSYFEVSLIISALLSLMTFYHYGYISFALASVWVAVVNQFYRHTVYNNETENNPLFERCIEITERTEKICVLMLMPTIVLLGLGRDDIPDSLVCSAGLAVLGLGLFKFSQYLERSEESEIRTTQQTVKVSKIE